MTQEEKWIAKYNEVIAFINSNKRNPTKHRIEEHLMLNFIKHNRKLLNKGVMKEERKTLFLNLLDLIEQNKRKNQYE